MTNSEDLHNRSHLQNSTRITVCPGSLQFLLVLLRHLQQLAVAARYYLFLYLGFKIWDLLFKWVIFLGLKKKKIVGRLKGSTRLANLASRIFTGKFSNQFAST